MKKSKTKSQPEPKNILIIIMAILILIILVYSGVNLINNYQNNLEQKDTYFVIEIIDGDTFIIETGERVRLICVDTPEIGEKSYNEAKEFLTSLIIGREVRLEQDIDNVDDYSRLLRYAYINYSGQELFVNREIVQVGLGKLFPYGNNTAKCGEISA